MGIEREFIERVNGGGGGLADIIRVSRDGRGEQSRVALNCMRVPRLARWVNHPDVPAMTRRYNPRYSSNTRRRWR
jgi:hypothetical protein